jgi:N-acetylneuraminate lyase
VRTVARNAVNGTAAEQMSLTVAEREKLHEHFVRLGAGKLDTIVAHCGASNLVDTKQLVGLCGVKWLCFFPNCASNCEATHDFTLQVAHAAAAGVQCVAVVMPTYFRARSIGTLCVHTHDMHICSEAIVEYCAQAARAAPNTPFMYYHIPIITGLQCKQ